MKVTDFINEIEKINCIDHAVCTNSNVYVRFKDDYLKDIPVIVIDKRSGSFYTYDTAFRTIPKTARKKLIRFCMKYALSSEVVNEETQQRLYRVVHRYDKYGDVYEEDLIYNDKTKEYRMRKNKILEYIDGDRELLTKKELDKYFKNHSTKGMHIKISVKD